MFVIKVVTSFNKKYQGLTIENSLRKEADNYNKCTFKARLIISTLETVGFNFLYLPGLILH